MLKHATQHIDIFTVYAKATDLYLTTMNMEFEIKFKLN